MVDSGFKESMAVNHRIPAAGGMIKPRGHQEAGRADDVNKSFRHYLDLAAWLRLPAFWCSGAGSFFMVEVENFNQRFGEYRADIHRASC